MSNQNDESTAQIARVYFTARQAIAAGQCAHRVIRSFDEIASNIVDDLKRNGMDWASAHVENQRLRHLLDTCEPDPVEDQPRFSFAWIRPILYCLTGSLVCVGLLILAHPH